MATFFISYSHQDRHIIEELVPQIRTVFSTEPLWFDDALTGGTKWWDAIISEITKCEIFIFLMSNDSVQSTYCQNELSKAFQLNKAILPVIVRSLTPEYPGNIEPALGIKLKSIQYDDLSKSLRDPLILNKLWGSINRLLKNSVVNVDTPLPNTNESILETPTISSSEASSDQSTRTILSRAERWILSNQFGILEKIDPDQEETWKQMRTVVENGYELNYDWMTSYIYGGDSVMSREECLEVLNILDMFTTLGRAYAEFDDKSDIDKSNLIFRGFDGNHETKFMAYTRFVIKKEGKFTELNDDSGKSSFSDFNSHFPMLPHYRLMLKEWEKLGFNHFLNRDDLKLILNQPYR